jgi:hypothetical protein
MIFLIYLKSTYFKKLGGVMKLLKVLMIATICLFALSSVSTAGDFGWTRNLNIQAQTDPSGFSAQLATRFKIGDVQVDAVLRNVDNPADAYIMLRLGEMSGRPIGHVIEEYKNYKGKGWGALAKSLGIKPGSQEFHALKQGHDMNDRYSYSKNFSSYDHNRNTNSNNFKGKGKGKK